MEYVDFAKLRKRGRINLIFPGWKEDERVAFFSPHDDDAMLGAGYLILATVRSGGVPEVVVFCRGDAGYSTPAEKKGISQRRKKEAARAYRTLGVREENIHFLDIPDFSLMSHLDRRPAWGEGIFDKIISILRKGPISRVVFSSGYLEHWDHTAVYEAGIYISSQAQDPILVDLGRPHPLGTFLSYSVWGDFEPAPPGQSTRADLGILAADKDEHRVIEAIRSFSSQALIIKNIVAHRKKRKTQGGYLELYKTINLRQPIDYSPYVDLLKKLS
ncbi:MAG: bacillithiol biosynthesis deacetylase BshB1 [Candidatus Aminicenantes bacterium]|nr:bacillithiol biosynthesis deacetylase BshB1 [Candidatus Aminicenantes bacterium]